MNYHLSTDSSSGPSLITGASEVNRQTVSCLNSGIIFIQRLQSWLYWSCVSWSHFVPDTFEWTAEGSWQRTTFFLYLSYLITWNEFSLSGFRHFEILLKLHVFEEITLKGRWSNRMSCILISSELSRNVLNPDPVDKTAAAPRPTRKFGFAL